MRETLYDESPPMFRNHPMWFILAVISLGAFGVGIPVLLFWYAWCRSRRLTITDSHLLYVEGLLSRRRTEVRLDSLRIVRVEQSLGQRILGTGNVEICTAGDEAELFVRGMPRPQELRDLLR